MFSAGDDDGQKGICQFFDTHSATKNRTRLVLSIELMPETLSSRLMVQSMRLAKAQLTKRFGLKVAGYATDIEGRCKSGRLV